jgi:Arc/MetJ-type ribon-helix-helix transcriptional regulator
MVSQNEYKNSSYVIRDALVRLMAEKDGAVGELDEQSLDELIELPKVTSSVLISFERSNFKLERKLNHIELLYHDSILHKSTVIHRNLKTITYILEDLMTSIQTLITEFNSIEDLEVFRYSINEPADLQ